MRRELSEKQLRTLRFIRDCVRLTAAPPTMQEIADHFGISRPSAYQRVVLLEKRGLVERTGARKTRSIRFLARGEDKVAPVRCTREIPILGVVPGGEPFLAEESTTGHLQVDEALARRGEVFALRVRGDSMKDAGILPGDYVIVRKQPVAESGDIVVALIGDEGTVKRLFVQGDRVELRPENRRMKPIVVRPSQRMQIVGKVIGVQRITKEGHWR